jgi:hypothetical protein
VGGTASNGVDYVTLPGSVTIPAGQRQALIAVVPIDDGPPDINSTLILALNTNAVTSTNTYLVGFPGRAGVIILDGQWPRPQPGMLPDKIFDKPPQLDARMHQPGDQWLDRLRGSGRAK